MKVLSAILLASAAVWVGENQAQTELVVAGWGSDRAVVHELLTDVVVDDLTAAGLNVRYQAVESGYDQFILNALSSGTAPDVFYVDVFDAWAEIRAEIDLDGDTIELFYNGSSTGAPWPWNGGQSGYGTGSNEIAAIDLWAAGATSPLSRVYYDDFKIEAGGGGCSSAPSSYCTSGTSATGCVANLSATGTSSATAASGFVVSATNVEGGNKSGLLYWGSAQKNPATSVGTSSSYQCVNPPVKRSQLLDGGGSNGNCDGTFSVDLNARWASQPAQNPGAGATVYAQLWYRDPANPSNQTTSRSDALTWTVCP